jgi:hypothetical protein
MAAILPDAHRRRGPRAANAEGGARIPERKRVPPSARGSGYLDGETDGVVLAVVVVVVVVVVTADFVTAGVVVVVAALVPQSARPRVLTAATAAIARTVRVRMRESP